MAYTTIKKLKVSGTNVQYFNSMDVNDFVGKLAAGTYVVTHLGGKTTQKVDDRGAKTYEWCKILYGNGEYYVTYRDETQLIDQGEITLFKNLVPQAMVNRAQNRINAANGRITNAEIRITNAQNLINQYQATIGEENALKDMIIDFVSKLNQRMTDLDEAITNRINAHKSSTSGSIAAHAAQMQQDIANFTNLNMKAVEKLEKETGLEIKELFNRVDNVIDPSTGRTMTIADVLESLFGLHRHHGLTAAEYDALTLTAAAYDGYALTAFAYATAGKILLV